MAWTSVNYACGHTGSEQMYGKASARESRVAWIERSRKCPDCYEQEKREESAKAAEKNTESGLPALIGTDGQVRYAEVIRAAVYVDVARMIGLASENADYLSEKKITVEEFVAFGQRILRQTSAKYYIDTMRGKDKGQLICYVITRILELRAEEAGKAILTGGGK